jgi:hypothetical protein
MRMGVDWTGSGLCTAEDFGISGLKPLVSAVPYVSLTVLHAAKCSVLIIPTIYILCSSLFVTVISITEESLITCNCKTRQRGQMHKIPGSQLLFCWGCNGDVGLLTASWFMEGAGTPDLGVPRKPDILRLSMSIFRLPELVHVLPI